MSRWVLSGLLMAWNCFLVGLRGVVTSTDTVVDEVWHWTWLLQERRCHSVFGVSLEP